MTNTRSGGAPRDPSATSTPANLRRSTRQTKGKRKSDLPATPSQRCTGVPSASNAQEDSTLATRKSTSVIKANTVSPALKQHPKRKNHGQKDNQNYPQTAGSLSKKRKRLDAKSYVAFFNTPEQQAESPTVLASPPRDEGEDASKVQVLDNEADLVCIQSDAHEQVNQEPSNKVLEGRSSDLHETPDAILERDELKIGCLQSEIISESHMPIEICSLNKAAEGIPMIEVGEQNNGDSNRACAWASTVLASATLIE